MTNEIKTWEEFWGNGLNVVVNQILHFFGWQLCLLPDGSVVPARTGFRGYSQDVVQDAHRKVSAYLKDNVDELYSEADSKMNHRFAGSVHNISSIRFDVINSIEKRAREKYGNDFYEKLFDVVEDVMYSTEEE